MVASPMDAVSGIYESWSPEPAGRDASGTTTTLAHGCGSAVAAFQGIVFVFVDLEDLYEPGELKNFPGRSAEAKEGKAAFQIARYFQSFDQGSNAGAVDVSHLEHVDDDARGAFCSQQIDQDFSN